MRPGKPGHRACHREGSSCRQRRRPVSWTPRGAPPKHDGIETFAIERGRACGYFSPCPMRHDLRAGSPSLQRPRHLAQASGLGHKACVGARCRQPGPRLVRRAPPTWRQATAFGGGHASAGMKLTKETKGPNRWWLHRRRPVCGNSRCPPSWVEARSTPSGGFWVSRRWRVLPGEAWTERRGGRFRSPRRQGTRHGGCGMPRPPWPFWNGSSGSLELVPSSAVDRPSARPRVQRIRSRTWRLVARRALR